MQIRSRAPLRIGFAGGGTDLPDYSNEYGGAVFNATIGMYAYCTIVPTDNGKIRFVAYDNDNAAEYDSAPHLDIDGDVLILHKGVYNRIVKEFNGGKPLSFIMSTSNDAPIGSGLGTYSTMVVAILEAFDRWLNLGLPEYKKAQLAYEIEREDLNLSGGKQDQYAAIFGGFNLIEFKQDGSTIVNTLRLEKQLVNELECSLLLYYGGRSRSSAKIINEQIKNTQNKNKKTIEAMHRIKQSANDMKLALLKGDMREFARILGRAWEDKKKMADELGIGEITLVDILKELEKPARDPRDEMPKPILRTDVLEMKDLKEGMILKGTVRNVIDFGAFVDIGVHQDGLVHVSEMSDKKFVKHPLDVVSVGDIVDVKVMGVDLKKQRIQLTMKL